VYRWEGDAHAINNLPGVVDDLKAAAKLGFVSRQPVARPETPGAVKSPSIELAPFTRAYKRAMSLYEFANYLERETFPPVHKVFLHHTWKPTPSSWDGYHTILAMKAYYERQLWNDAKGVLHEGWTAGPHIFVAPDGIWLFSDLHFDGVGVAGHNTSTRHVEMVGDYDNVEPTGDILVNTLGVLALLHRKFGLPPEHLGFHRDYSTKTCPGSAVSKNKIITQTLAWLNTYEAGLVLDRDKLLKTAAYSQVDIAYTPDHALMQYAHKHNLGAALDNEFEATINGQIYAVQSYALGLVLCPKGQWDKCTHVGW